MGCVNILSLYLSESRNYIADAEDTDGTEGKKDGRTEGWKGGRGEGWRVGGVEEGKIGNIAEGLVRLEDEFVLWRCIAPAGR